MSSDAKKALVKKLHDAGVFKFGEFTLKSGQFTPVYIDLRSMISKPQLFVSISNLNWSYFKPKVGYFLYFLEQSSIFKMIYWTWKLSSLLWKVSNLIWATSKWNWKWCISILRPLALMLINVLLAESIGQCPGRENARFRLRAALRCAVRSYSSRHCTLCD